MIIKKFYGKTIQEALKEAKEQLGDSVILIESVAAKNGTPAQVTIMLDEKLASNEKRESGDENEFRNVFYSRQAVKTNSDQNSKSDQNNTDVNVIEKGNKNKLESKEQKNDRKSIPDLTLKRKSRDESKLDDLPEPKGPDIPSSNMSRHKVPLIEIRTSENNGLNATARDSGVSREVAAIHRRLAQIESMMSDSLISANLDYASHTAFQQLLKTGIRGTTISGWFREIMNTGIDPFEDKDSFLFELGKLIRNVLTVDQHQPAQPNMVFVGASGAGKTTLVMKLATSTSFFIGKEIAIVSVEPRNTIQKYSILEPFCNEEGIPFYKVKDGIDVSKLMQKLVNYDHVLFDTPSISLEKKTAFREYWKIRQILASVMPLEVHFVVNAAMENYYFREAYAENHPLQPDYVAITHLDETQRWGHLIPFLKTMACSVRYISRGQQIPDDVNAFSPTWFAEQILSISNE